MSSAGKPVVVSIPYNSANGVRSALDSLDRTLTDTEQQLLLEYPTVYIIHSRQDSPRNRHSQPALVYVGETNDIEVRTRQHRIDDTRDGSNTAWQAYRDNQLTRMYIIGHRHFNKSLTLDVENRFMGYVLAADADATLGVTNGRGNPQNNYYTREELDEISSAAWRRLHSMDEHLFPAERVIKSSAIFKASPFHRLSDEQYQAEELILRQLDTARGSSTQRKQLILVEGAAGTGKTVLLSHLFLQIAKILAAENNPNGNSEDALLTYSAVDNMAIVVNHDEQKTVYDAIAKRLGLQDRNGQVVFKGTEFINRYSKSRSLFAGQHGLTHQLHPAKELDVVLVDEAHLLLNEGNQGYVGHHNQLWDIAARARVVIAVYDPEQVLRKSQEIPQEMIEALFAEDRFVPLVPRNVCERYDVSLFGTQVDVTNIRLNKQFRIDAGDEIIQWIDDFASGNGIGPIPRDTKLRRDDSAPYEIKVFSSPIELYKAIVQKAGDEKKGLSRLTATYDWAYRRDSRPDGIDIEYWSVSLRRDGDTWVYSDELAPESDMAQTDTSGDHFTIPWNYQLRAESGNHNLRDRDAAWAEKAHTLREAGSIYTIQGFDLNYAGVIIGPSVQWRNGRLVFDPSHSKNYQAINGSERPKDNLRHELNVLLKRGVHGLYLFAVDQELQRHLQEMAAG